MGSTQGYQFGGHPNGASRLDDHLREGSHVGHLAMKCYEVQDVQDVQGRQSHGIWQP